MEISQYDLVKKITHDIEYAAKSYSRELMYQTLGFIEGLMAANALNMTLALNYHSQICREYLNNPEWFHEVNRRDKI